MWHVERIDTLRKLEELEGSWNRLIADCPPGEVNLFLSHEWISAWWTHFGGDSDLWVLVVKDDNDLMGIAPLMLGRQKYSGLPVRMLSFMDNKHTSRGDFIIPDKKREVIREVVRYLEKHAERWDVLRLVNLPRESGHLTILEEELADSRLTSFPAAASSVLFHLPLPGTWEEYFQQQGINFRKNIRRFAKRLEAAGTIEIVIENGKEDMELSMNRLFELEPLSWKAQHHFAHCSPTDILFHKALARKFAAPRSIDNRFLCVNGSVVGGTHCIVYNGVAYGLLTYYDQSYEELSAGRALFTSMIKDFISNPAVSEFDFNGESKFVRTWTKGFRSFDAISACNPRPYSQIVAHLKKIKRMFYRQRGEPACSQ